MGLEAERVSAMTKKILLDKPRRSPFVEGAARMNAIARPGEQNGDVPFVAAGRDSSKLKSAMESNVAGIETADYEITEVTHDVASLTELFSGASVVCNTVGPFSKWGPEVVEACLAGNLLGVEATNVSVTVGRRILK